MFRILKLDRRAPWALRHAGAIGLLAAALAVGACGGPAPTPSLDPSQAIHFQSRINQAVAVDIASRGGGGPSYSAALRPCGGPIVLVPGLSGVPVSELLITLLLDPTGNLDGQLAMFSGEPHDLPGTFNDLSILWSTGEIQLPALPRWITVTPEVVVVEATPPAVDATCGPWLQQR